jgi:hypothetical protein
MEVAGCWLRLTCDDSEVVKMHHTLFACETGPKQQLSFECFDSKNNNLLCLGKTSMGVTCDVLRTMRAAGLRAISRFFFQPSRLREKLKT